MFVNNYYECDKCGYSTSIYNQMNKEQICSSPEIVDFNLCDIYNCVCTVNINLEMLPLVEFILSQGQPLMNILNGHR
jgi:hypothetical protein